MEQLQLASLVAKVANARELADSLAMREAAYGEVFHEKGVDLHDRTAIQLVVSSGNEVVAGARMIGPTPLPLEIGLPAHELLPQAEDGSIAIGQLGGLWLHPRYHRLSTVTAAICRKLFQKACEIGTRLGASAFVLRTSEHRMTKWYAAVGFELVPEWSYEDPLWGKVFTMLMPLNQEHAGSRRGGRLRLRNGTKAKLC